MPRGTGKVAVFSAAKKQPISYENLMTEASEGAFKALKVLAEISNDAGHEPRDRVVAAAKQVELFIKLAGLVEVDPNEALPVLRAISNAGK
jgi:phosphoketolase